MLYMLEYLPHNLLAVLGVFFTLPSSLRLKTVESLQGVNPATSAKARFGIQMKVVKAISKENKRFIKIYAFKCFVFH